MNAAVVTHTKRLIIQSNYLWFLTLTYSMVIVFANLFDARLIQIAGLVTDSGTIIFPLTFLLCDLITEVYGYKYARRAIWCGFLFTALFILYGQLVIHLPSPHFQTNNAVFDNLLNLNTRIIVASTISYLSAEPTNSFLMAKLKIKMQGRHLGLRFMVSTFMASGIDSFIFSIIAFYGLMTNANLLQLILTMWLVKITVQMIGLPVVVSLTKKLKKLEQMDMYDRHTDFNLFGLDISYSEQDNGM